MNNLLIFENLTFFKYLKFGDCCLVLSIVWIGFRYSYVHDNHQVLLLGTYIYDEMFTERKNQSFKYTLYNYYARKCDYNSILITQDLRLCTILTLNTTSLITNYSLHTYLY